MKFEPFPYLTGSTWVCSSGKNDEVIAAPLEKSIGPFFGMIAPVRASEFVLDNFPNAGESFLSFRFAFIWCINFWVL